MLQKIFYNKINVFFLAIKMRQILLCRKFLGDNVRKNYEKKRKIPLCAFVAASVALMRMITRDGSNIFQKVHKIGGKLSKTLNFGKFSNYFFEQIVLLDTNCTYLLLLKPNLFKSVFVFVFHTSFFIAKKGKQNHLFSRWNSIWKSKWVANIKCKYKWSDQQNIFCGKQ